MKKLLDVKTAAQLLSVSKTTIRRLIAEREIKSVKIRRSLRIPVEGIEKITRGTR